MNRHKFTAEPSLKDQIRDFVKKVYTRKGNVPSLTEIRGKFKISIRKLYSTFPDGIVEICELAGVPVPAERVKIVQNALKARSKRVDARVREELDEGEIAGQVFNLLENRTPLPQVVISLRIPPDQAKELYEKWTGLKKIDVNQPVVLRRLKALENLAVLICSICQTVEQLLALFDDSRVELFQDPRSRNNFQERLCMIRNRNFKTIGAIIETTKAFDGRLCAFFVEKAIDILGYDSFTGFIQDNGFEELGMTVEDLRDLLTENLARTLGATRKDLERLGIRRGPRKRNRVSRG